MRELTRSQEIGLALSCAVVTANAYYIHPIIGEVADHFGVGHSEIGIVPALNQIALAIGIFFLLPLGDRFSNRSLTILFVAGQTACLALMTLAEGFLLFTLGSTLLGFVTIAPYLLPAYASKRVPPERLGHVTALLTAGVIFGILVARVGAGVVTEYFGWRTVYWIATGAMAVTMLLLPRLMEGRASERTEATPYLALLSSLFALLKSHRAIVLSGVIQAFNFGAFIALWLGLALHLTSAEMGYGVDTVGYLAAIAAVSVISTPRLGQWADKVGPYRARAVFAVIQMAGLALFWPLGYSLWGLVVPLVLANLVGPGIDVAGRMTFLSLAPDLRTRLTTIYIVLMFTGGGLGSLLGTFSYDHFGWPGTCVLLLVMSGALTALSIESLKRQA
ncbi:MFS transporter [Qipengyuania sp. JC766]|uniref:MFS transporter n=1 Tax=Qipengyuania sp. JC766 TaxID=3232139 RepID=UPI003458F5E5